MSNSNNQEQVNIKPVSRRMFGRKQIFSSAKEINRQNVIEEVITKAFDMVHTLNRFDIEYLYKYFKGDQPILYRQKSIREDILNVVVENRASEIVAFKTGYLCGSPIQYISRNKDVSSEKVDALNDIMLTLSKASLDKELIEWQNICGTSYRMVVPGEKDNETPYVIYTLDPRNTFVIYSDDVSHRPLAGVYYVVNDDNITRRFSVYTPTEVFEINEGEIVNQQKNGIGMIPIVEYPANNSRMGAFEVVLPLLDAINTVDSNRIDGVEQFIQSLIVLYNCTLEGEDATTLQQKGLIELKSIGENKADIKILSEQLNQSETQVLKQDMYQTILEIVGMPSQGNGSTGDSSNNGAVILKNGWQGAEARAKDSELMFKKSEREFLKIVIRICEDLYPLGLKLGDIDIHFTRRNYEDILAKSQVLTTMLASDKIAPKLAFQASGLFVDSEEAYQESKTYVEELQSRQMAQMVVTEDNTEDEKNEIPITD